MVSVTEQVFVRQCDFDHRNLQAAQQQGNFRGNVVVVEDGFKDHAHQVDDVVVILVEFAGSLLAHGMGQLVFQQQAHVLVIVLIVGGIFVAEGVPFCILQSGQYAEQVLAL